MSQVCITGALVALLRLAALGQTPAFEAASIKSGTVVQMPAGSRAKSTGSRVTEDPGRITYQNVTLLRVLMRAYDVKQRQITAPSWFENETYDIVATLPAGASKEQIPVMLQNLLADRFKMTVRVENRPERIYNLTAGKNPRLKKSEDTEPSRVDFDREGHIQFTGFTLAAFADALTNMSDRAILDATGLPGRYDISTHLNLPAPPPDADSHTASDPAPSLFTAMQDLGLKLEPAEGAVKHIVIEKADKVPTAN